MFFNKLLRGTGTAIVLLSCHMVTIRKLRSWLFLVNLQTLGDIWITQSTEIAKLSDAWIHFLIGQLLMRAPGNTHGTFARHLWSIIFFKFLVLIFKLRSNQFFIDTTLQMVPSSFFLHPQCYIGRIIEPRGDLTPFHTFGASSWSFDWHPMIHLTSSYRRESYWSGVGLRVAPITPPFFSTVKVIKALSYGLLVRWVGENGQVSRERCWAGVRLRAESEKI